MRLPEGDLAAGRRGDDAAPARGALAGLEQDGGAQVARALGGRADLGDLDVGQPQRALGGALDDAAAELAAQLEREVRAVAGVDAVRAPVAELRVEGARARQVAGVQLEVHHWCGGGEHDLWLLRPRERRKLIASR